LPSKTHRRAQAIQQKPKNQAEKKKIDIDINVKQTDKKNLKRQEVTGNRKHPAMMTIVNTKQGKKEEWKGRKK